MEYYNSEIIFFLLCGLFTPLQQKIQTLLTANTYLKQEQKRAVNKGPPAIHTMTTN